MLIKSQLLSILEDMPDNTEICTPSLRDPANAITQIARTEITSSAAGNPVLVLVPVTILPFRNKTAAL